MVVKFRLRRDPIKERRWFAFLCGTMVNKTGVHDVTRFFFPWFYIDFVFPRPTPTQGGEG